MHQQHQYWQSQAHPNSQYLPNQYQNRYPPQNAPKQPPTFKSQSELGFELPPVRPAQGQVQQRPTPIAASPLPSPRQGRPRPQSIGYPQVNSGFPPPIHANGASGIPPQPIRSSSASPTRKPLPAPAPGGNSRPLTVTQKSGFSPLPPNRPQSMDLSAFSRFNQERMASGAISAGTVRSAGPVNAYPNSYNPQHFQYPHKNPVAISSAPSISSPPTQYPHSPQSFSHATVATSTRRRTSPPRFFGTGSAHSSRNASPDKVNFNSQINAHSNHLPNQSHTHLPQSSPSQSQVAVSSFQSAPQSSPSFSTASSAALRQRNPIFDTQSSPTRSGYNSSNTETKFVPLWKRSTIKPVDNGSPEEKERGRVMTVPPTSPGRPLPQPTPTNRFPQYTVEEPEDDAANSSFESETNSEFSTAASAISANSQRSGASNGPGILDLRGSMPQPPIMDRGAATTGALPKTIPHIAGSRFESRNIPQPPGMDRAGATTGAIHEGTTSSLTLRFAKMGLESAGSGSSWPQDLPPLPRGPGSGFSSSGSSSRPTSSHGPSSSSRHSHSQSQPQTHSSFAPVSSKHGRAERMIPDYDLDEPPPRPASASFSTRSVSPAGSTASSTSGALERFRRNTQQPVQPQPQHASYHRANNRPENTGHATSYAGVKIESPSPLGGKERMANVRKMEKDSNRTSDARAIPTITFDNNDQRSQRTTPEVPRMTFGDEENQSGPIVLVSGQGPPIPRITFGNDSDEDDDNTPPSVPLIRIGGEEEVQKFEPKTPQIVFEVPGMGVDSQFKGPVINEEGDYDTPRRKGAGAPVALRQGGPRTLPSARSGVGLSGRGGLTCPACGRPIVGRVVGAMGMKWHPDCFRCTICNELLEFQSSYEGVGEDGIKRPYCHLDYHETFAPKCYHCKTAIVEERFISLNDLALGRRTYHEQHFFCAECGDPFLSPSSAAKHNHERDFGKANGEELTFSGDGTFSYDDEDDNVGFTVYKGHPYCEACHVRLRLPKCKKCKRPIRDHMEAVEALGGKWCWECFRCTSCDQPFEDPSYFERDKKPYCENCFSVMIRNEI
ncbi:hypothetical protein DFJ43DRAFT_1077063 [Lentinula guzmanii]|uniref:LIM zinc-binding domain-containing protein n=1 Tax=Lentinula guzmanii TaxID=2804957 RepID=A0AA38MZC0_9AGAR|nr:hypothetical protein DFJ43DRAFT_1077063 [Lentinula guzmanii]